MFICVCLCVTSISRLDRKKITLIRAKLFWLWVDHKVFFSLISMLKTKTYRVRISGICFENKGI